MFRPPAIEESGSIKAARRFWSAPEQLRPRDGRGCSCCTRGRFAAEECEGSESGGVGVVADIGGGMAGVALSGPSIR